MDRTKNRTHIAVGEAALESAEAIVRANFPEMVWSRRAIADAGLRLVVGASRADLLAALVGHGPAEEGK